MYVNGLSNAWTAKTVGKAGAKMFSRRYDIEFRTQYFYSYDAESQTYTEIALSVPMLFVQEENFSTLSADIKEKNNIDVTTTMASADLIKLQEDYDTLIDTFIANKAQITKDAIIGFVGTAKQFDE